MLFDGGVDSGGVLGGDASILLDEFVVAVLPPGAVDLVELGELLLGVVALAEDLVAVDVLVHAAHVVDLGDDGEVALEADVDHAAGELGVGWGYEGMGVLLSWSKWGWWRRG